MSDQVALTGTERLPRFRRADSPPPLRLTERDQQILQLVARCRYLRTEQIFRRLFPKGALSNCRRRLRLLYHHGFLVRVPGPELGSLVYAVDRRALNLLRREEGVHVKLSRARPVGSSEPLRHLLAVNTFRLALELAAEHLDADLNWLGEEELRGRPPFAGFSRVNAGWRPPVPDAYIVLTLPPRRMRFFLEVDMGTEDAAVIRRKVRSHLSLYATGSFQRAFAPESDPTRVSLRVLFVATLGHEHAQRLSSWIGRALRGGPHAIQGLFWVTDLEAASEPSRLLGEPVWLVAAEDGPKSLVGLMPGPPAGLHP